LLCLAPQLVQCSEMSWDCRVALFKKMQSECTALINVVRAGVPVCDVIRVYCAVVCSVLEYTCPM